MGVYRDNGKENGNYYLGCRVYAEGSCASLLEVGGDARICAGYHFGLRGWRVTIFFKNDDQCLFWVLMQRLVVPWGTYREIALETPGCIMAVPREI